MYELRKIILLIVICFNFSIFQINFAYGSGYVLKCDLRGIGNSENPRDHSGVKFDKIYNTFQSHSYSNYSMKFNERKLDDRKLTSHFQREDFVVKVIDRVYGQEKK